MPILVPERVNRQTRETQQQYAAEVIDGYETYQELEYWNRELKQIDPYLELVKVPEHVTHLPGVKPGYYHIVRHNPGTAPSIEPHQGDNGEFREPDSGIFETLRKSDMWSTRTQKQREKKQRELERAREREREREREERVDEVMARFSHRVSPKVHIPRAI